MSALIVTTAYLKSSSISSITLVFLIEYFCFVLSSTMFLFYAFIFVLFAYRTRPLSSLGIYPNLSTITSGIAVPVAVAVVAAASAGTVVIANIVVRCCYCGCCCGSSPFILL